jgi:hypothetical protein
MNDELTARQRATTLRLAGRPVQADLSRPSALVSLLNRDPGTERIRAGCLRRRYPSTVSAEGCTKQLFGVKVSQAVASAG